VRPGEDPGSVPTMALVCIHNLELLKRLSSPLLGGGRQEVELVGASLYAWLRTIDQIDKYGAHRGKAKILWKFLEMNKRARTTRQPEEVGRSIYLECFQN
jgi:hypothetical protein